MEDIFQNFRNKGEAGKQEKMIEIEKRQHYIICLIFQKKN